MKILHTCLDKVFPSRLKSFRIFVMAPLFLICYTYVEPDVTHLRVNECIAIILSFLSRDAMSFTPGWKQWESRIATCSPGSQKIHINFNWRHGMAILYSVFGTGFCGWWYQFREKHIFSTLIAESIHFGFMMCEISNLPFFQAFGAYLTCNFFLSDTRIYVGLHPLVVFLTPAWFAALLHHICSVPWISCE